MTDAHDRDDDLRDDGLGDDDLEHGADHRDGDPDATDAGGPRGHPAVYARNWRTVLAVDAAMGLIVVAAGIVVAIAWNIVAGGLLGSLGIAYVFAVVRRGRQWGQLRRDAGL